MDVAAWLQGLNLGQYEEAFRANAIDAVTLPKLTGDDLKEIGVAAVGHRRRLLEAIAALRAAHPPTDAPATPRVPGSEPQERRQVAVLFADLAGYTRLSTELDAEDLHAVRVAFTGVIDEIVAAHGGSIERHIGDSVMAVFGAPIARGNDAERAVRTALAIREAMPALSRRFGRPIDVHIGLASGQVVATGIGRAGSKDFTITGETVNLASRLTSQARSGEIFISAAVRSMLGASIDCIDAGALSVKGFVEAVPAFRLAGMARAQAGSEFAFVGRQREMGQLVAAATACVETGAGQTVYLRGEAGIGKTRLLGELREHAALSTFAWHTGLVLDFGMGTSRDALRSLVRSLMGVRLEEDAELARERAQAAVADGIRADRLMFLNNLLGLSQPLELRRLYDALDNAQRRRGAQETVAELVMFASRVQPLLLVIEDIHWADQFTLEAISALGATVTECRTILVVTSRREGDPLAHGWHVPGPCLTIDLAPLRHAEALLLASTFAGSLRSFAERCIERAAGNPLFLEQLLRHADERSEGSVPHSVQSIVQARMDGLDPADKHALQAAAIFGQRFSIDALRNLVAQPSYHLGSLIAQNLIRPHGEEFLFSHALIRDAVYATLLRSRRRELHMRAAEWFGARDLAIAAGHLDMAGDPGAPQAYLAAAREQASQYRYQAALMLADRGAALARDPGNLAALACCRGELLHDLGAIQEAREAHEMAFSLAQDDAHRCLARLGLAAVKRITDDLDGALVDLAEVVNMAAQSGFSGHAARAHFLRGNVLFPRGDIEGCLREHATALELAQKAGSSELEAAALGGLGDAEYLRGRMLSAQDRFRRCVELSRQGGYGRIEVANRPMAAFARWFGGDASGALEEALAAIEAATKVGHARAEMIAHHAAYFCRHDRLEVEAARHHAERSLLLAQQLGARRFEAEALAFSGELHRLAGQRPAALADLDAALAISRAIGMSFLGPIILGYLAVAAGEDVVRSSALSEGEALLAGKAVAHNHLLFRRDAIDACLSSGDIAAAERHVTALEDFTRPEPTPWTGFVIGRGRALALRARGENGPNVRTKLQSLLTEGERLSMRIALPQIEAALAAPVHS